MNTRDYKQSGANEFYHIYNRGNLKDSIFLDDDDYQFFLLRLHQNLFPEKWSKNRYNRIQPLPPNSFSILSYCLMPNHFHILIRQNRELSPGKLILKLCTSYSKYFNKKYDRVGHLFQDRFRQILVDDDEYLKWLGAYIHLNPKTASLVKKTSDYRWSSYPEYLNGNEGFCSKLFLTEQFKNKNDFYEFTETAYEPIKNKKGLEHLLLDE